MNTAAKGPQQYTTEHGGLDDIAIPAVFNCAPQARPSAPPAPRASGTEARVCADIAQRQLMGLRKYGTTVADNPLSQRQWLQHAYEEALDLAIYLRRSIEQMQADAPTHASTEASTGAPTA